MEKQVNAQKVERVVEIILHLSCAVVIVVYASLALEYFVFPEKVEGVATVISEGQSPQWYEFYRFSKYKDAKFIVKKKEVDVPNYVSKGVEAGHVEVYYGKYSGTVFEVSGPNGLIWRMLSFLNIFLVVVLVVGISTPLRELQVFNLFLFLSVIKLLGALG